MGHTARILNFPEKEAPAPARDPLTEARYQAALNVWIDTNLSEATRRAYQNAARLFLGASGQSDLLGVINDEGIALAAIEAFLDVLATYKPATRRLYLTAVGKLFRAAENCGLVGFKTQAQFKLPPRKQAFIYPDDLPTPEMCLEAIMTEREPCNAWAFKVLYFMALRTSEVCELRWEQLRVFGDVLAFEVTGKGSTSLVRVPKQLVGEMISRAGSLARMGLVCPSPNGRAYSRLRLFRACQRAWERVGYKPSGGSIGMGGHLWRHCHASHAKAAGVDRETLRISMRHTSDKTQDLYVHVAPPSSGDFLQNAEVPQ